jgi:tRNA(Arg) A34 adenosine deaminase TadA
MVARSAIEHGNHPFGALLADKDGKILLTAENSVVTDRDCTAHAETNLIRKACKAYESSFLSSCTIYASTEPCPMCAGAIFWANVRRVVFGLSEEKLYAFIGDLDLPMCLIVHAYQDTSAEWGVYRQRFLLQTVSQEKS